MERATQLMKGIAAVDAVALLATARPDRESRLLTAWSPFLALVALVTLVVVWLASGSPRQSVGDSAVREGSSVIGTGYLIEKTPGGRVQLCLGGGRLMGPPTCSVVAVPVDGVQWDSVPGATEDGIWYAEHVTVGGTWTGETLVMDSVSAAPTGAPAVPNPCAADDDDGDGLGASAGEAELRSLNVEVLGNPNRYAGLWRAGSADAMGPMVVGVVGDPSSVEPTLRDVYPFELCLVEAEFSENQLEATLDAIGLSTADWVAAVDYPRNRVTVSVPVLSEETWRRLEPYADRIFIEELLQPA